MPVLWFQGPDGAPFQFQCMQGIHVPTLAGHLQLKPRPLMLNGVVVDFDSSTGYSPFPDLQEAMGEHAGTTRESAIQVTGQPAGAAGGGAAAAAAAAVALFTRTGIAAPAAAAAASGPVTDDGLAAWAQQLVALEEQGGCLRLPGNLTKNLPSHLSKSVYIRRSYRKLYQLLCSALSAAQHPLGFVVTGTPGIGKSAFALYLIWQLGKQRKIVFYDYQTYQCRATLKFDFTMEQATGQRMQALVVDEDLCSDKAWYIYEGPPPDHLQYDGKTTVVVLSSPNHNNFHQFTKGEHCHDRPLYMPTWSLEELQTCRQLLYPKLSAETAAERYSWLGGTIRYVLVRTSTCAEEVVRTAVGKSPATQLEAAIKMGNSCAANFSHTLGHFQARSDFNVRYVTFASPRIADLVLEHLASELRASLEQFLVASADDSSLAGLRGVLFERHGHKVFMQGGFRCRWRQLHPPPARKRSHAAVAADDGDDDDDAEASHHFCGDAGQVAEDGDGLQQPADVAQQQLQQLSMPERYVAPTQLSPLWDDGAQPMDTHSCSSNAYILPRSSNNAAWDAMVLGGCAPLILQYTVSRTHGIKARPLEKLLQRLNAELRPAVKLVFVVPPGVFNSFRWQPWQSVKGATLVTVPPTLAQLQQWVMELKVEPSPRSSSSSGGDGSTRSSSGGKSGSGGGSGGSAVPA